jgi:histidyl-tRNA synthetase
MIQSLRGMKDILNKDSELFTYFIENCSAIAKNYGFSYIETPILEETALFKRSVGQSSDIVNKEMYQFTDKGDNDVCLRPEGTAGVVRSFIQNKSDRAGGTYRYFYYGPMFRYERPQKGRLRQFHQFGCESFGVDSIYEDANIILMLSDILNFFEIEYELQLNSLGCKDCMPTYKQKLVDHIKPLDLCEDCNRRIETNPIRVLDCKNDNCQKELSNAPKITQNLCEKCDNDFEKLKSILEQNNIKFTVDSNLVRGLDYYSGAAFEFISKNIGAQSAIAGGGRYDRLVEFLGGKPTKGIGFAIGIERLLELIVMKQEQKELLYIAPMCDEAINKVFSLAHKKRKTTKTICEYKARSFTKHLNNAQKAGATKVVLIGEKELQNNTVWIKDLQSKKEDNITIEEF